MLAHLLQPNTPIIVAYSNGPDSRYLFEQLYKKWPADQLILVYCHHGLRTDADTEAKLTQDLAQSKGVKSIIRHIPVKHYQHRYKVSEEMAGHFLRKSVLLHYAKQYKAQVCTGHHQDDAHETAWIKHERGIKSGQTHLHARFIQYNVPFIKPLLDTTKNEILAYLNRQNIAYSIDKSNTDTRYLRNAIRQENRPPLAPISFNNIQEKWYTILNTHMVKEADYCIIKKHIFQQASPEELHTIAKLLPQLFQEYYNQKCKILPPYWAINTDHIQALLSAMTAKEGGKYALPVDHEIEWNSRYLGVYNKHIQQGYTQTHPDNKTLKEKKVLRFYRQRLAVNYNNKITHDK
jgi:tRNA(Ile)-lysidine synthetase-like protein